MYKLEFTEQEVNQIINALAKLPYIEVFKLLANIQQQVNKKTETE